MVGANYMGGKRSTVRAKSKDVIGRAQRRHFGKQRLVSALRVTQGNRVHQNAVPPQITLAHARSEKTVDSSVTSLRGVVSGDRLYAPTSQSDAARHKKPSKILGALETLDHVSMRAAIDRILQQPNLVGINASIHKETAYMERVQAPVVVKPQTKAHLDATDSDTWNETRVSTHGFNPTVFDPKFLEHKLTGPYRRDPNRSYEHTKNDTFSPLDSPSRHPEATSWDTHHDRFSDPFDPPSWSQSSPLPFLSQSDNSILNLDTSAYDIILSGRDDHSSREDDTDMDASTSSSDILPAFHRLSWSYPGQECTATMQRTTLPLIDSPEEETEAKPVRYFPSAENGNRQHAFPGEYGCDEARFSTRPEVVEGDLLCGVSLDFLSDPDPWETIGRILNLVSAETPTSRSVELDFTKDREGVGYISEESRTYDELHSHASSPFETSTNAKPMDDIHAVSNPDRAILMDLEALRADDRMATDAIDSSNSLFNGVIPSTAHGKVDNTSRVHARQEAPLTPAVHDNAHIQPLSPITSAVETTSAAQVADFTFAGPCLFGDSDLEEDG